MLELRPKVLDPEYPATLVCMRLLAEVLKCQGKHEAAEDMHQQA